MFEQAILSRQYALHWALLGLVAVIFLSVVCSGWLSNYALFAFPFGTFVIGVIAPLAIVAIAVFTPYPSDEESENA